MITKRCKSNIRMHTIYSALFIGILMISIIWAVMFFLRVEKDILQVLIVSGCVLLACFIVGCFFSLFKVSKFKKHLKNEHGNSIDQEIFTALDKRYSISKDWLVYHLGVHYVPLYKSNIQSLQFDGHQLQIYVTNKNGVYIFKCKADTNQAIQDWFLKND